MVVKVAFDALAFDPSSKSPLIILTENGGSRQLVLAIGLVEASAIAAATEGLTAERPMTHDLMGDLVNIFGASLTQVEIYDLLDDTYYATMVLDLDGEAISLECNPSDGITMALKLDADILVHEQVFERVGLGSLLITNDNTEDELLASVLEDMDEEDFGEYKM
jgi:uncharacterized protein